MTERLNVNEVKVNYFRIVEMKIHFAKTRWKRENFIKRLQHEINKETQNVAETTGVTPWVILGV